jgi:mannose-1-phosphate guanylyltransferase
MVIGVVDDGYWLDLGTPLAFAKGSADLVRGIAPSPLLVGRTGEALIEPTAKVDASASVTGGTYVGHNAIIGAGAIVTGNWIDGVIIAWLTLMIGVIGAIGYAIATTGSASSDTVARATQDAVQKAQEKK